MNMAPNTNTLTPREWLCRKGNAYAAKLAECGYLSEREAQVYVLHTEMGLSREDVMDELDLDPGEYDSAISKASEKIDAVSRTAKVLWTQPDDWAEYDVDPITPNAPEFCHSLKDEFSAAGVNIWGDVTGAYIDAYTAACRRAARDELDHGDHPCIIRDVLYLEPNRDSWLDVFAAEWGLDDVRYERVRRTHLDALNAVQSEAPIMLKDATLRARVVGPTDENEDEGF